MDPKFFCIQILSSTLIPVVSRLSLSFSFTQWFIFTFVSHTFAWCDIISSIFFMLSCRSFIWFILSYIFRGFRYLRIVYFRGCLLLCFGNCWFFLFLNASIDDIFCILFFRLLGWLCGILIFGLLLCFGNCRFFLFINSSIDDIFCVLFFRLLGWLCGILIFIFFSIGSCCFILLNCWYRFFPVIGLFLALNLLFRTPMTFSFVTTG